MSADPADPNGGAAFCGEDSWSWLCACGHYEGSPYHCEACGCEPPWGCPCEDCNFRHRRDIEGAEWGDDDDFWMQSDGDLLGERDPHDDY